MPSSKNAPSVRAVGKYWLAHPTVNGKRRNWSFGPIATVTREQAQTALNARLNSLPGASSSNSRTVEGIVALYLTHAEKIYVRGDGTPTGQAENLMYGLQPLIDIFGAMRAEDFRTRHMKAYVDHQIKNNVSRQTINARLRMIKRWLRWAKNEEFITPLPYEQCRDFESVKLGRGAREAKAIRAVPMAQVEQTLPFLPATIQTMVRLQLATAMRPEEVCAMRLVDIDVSKTPWLYIPRWHKNKHRGQERRIYLGPVARELLQPYMTRALDAELFSPRVAVRERRGKMPTKGLVSDCYDTRAYRKAIWFACDRAFPVPEELKRKRVDAKGRKAWRWEEESEWLARIGEEKAKRVLAWRREYRWAPNRLRKTALDMVERVHGKQAAKSVAGHSRVETTQAHYLSQDDSLARTVAEKAG